ncbi:MAG: hypothetical protein ABJF23_28230 [Bryobacteraceae bacterium]
MRKRQRRKPRGVYYLLAGTALTTSDPVGRSIHERHCKLAPMGLHPQTAPDANNAIYTLSQIGIDASAHEPRGVGAIDLKSFDYIVAMDASIARELRPMLAGSSSGKLRTWNISDPFGDDLSKYNICAQRILRELKKLVGAQ